VWNVPVVSFDEVAGVKSSGGGDATHSSRSEFKMRSVNQAVFATVLVVLHALPAAAQSVVTVTDNASLATALRSAGPGATIRIAAGEYRGGVAHNNLRGTRERPITIEAADPENPPLFGGGNGGWHLSDCSYLVLRNLRLAGQAINGLNLDDGGDYDTPTHHILIEGLRITDVGPRGNHDPIKLSGVDDFTVRRCRIEGWGGQGVDMVGCHRGTIEKCVFRGKENCTQTAGVQVKGGTSDIVIRRCLFDRAAARGVNIGGSTGLPFFRPREVKYEAKDISVEGCVFIGNQAPVAYVGVDGATVRYNTIVHPDKWVARILQETTAPGFAPCRDGRFENNLIVFKRASLRTFVNVGPNTRPDSFAFAKNLWYCDDRPEASRPQLPVAETDGVYGVDPQLSESGTMPFRPMAARAKAFGAWALPTAEQPENKK
jgi:hypothetical protein